MSSLANQLKSEISRIARKEIKSDSKALKQASSRYRAEIAELKRRLAALESLVKKLSKGAARSSAPASATAPTAAAGALRFRPAGFASLRKKLGLSAQEMGKLVGVSAQSVYHWEAGKSKPRASQLQAIAQVRHLGKREVQARLG
jgi:DNA-binding transcriptional regulator YiaG